VPGAAIVGGSSFAVPDGELDRAGVLAGVDDAPLTALLNAPFALHPATTAQAAAAAAKRARRPLRRLRFAGTPRL